jgi:glyoxylase-like metal-dependent hydrolase (beta-lactamase superfamily II)
MEVATDIHQLKIPIPGNPLGYLCAYLIQTPESCMLIDTGWKTEAAFEALRSQLQDVGVTWEDLDYIVITHVHPDHYGLVGQLRGLTHAKLVIHEIEQSFLESRYVETDPLVGEMDHWLKINGVPLDVRPMLNQASMSMLGMVAIASPDLIVQGGEHLRVGEFDLEILWTPGHSAGHICLYDRAKRLLFSGDHVLGKITPNISMHTQSNGNPLTDYFNSLRQVAALPVDLVLPAHGDVFQDLPKRVAEIEAHHDLRLKEILAVIGDGAKTAYQVASLISWSTGKVTWDNLPPLSKRMAVTETLAHLELLAARETLEKDMRQGVVWYLATPGK